FVPGRHFRYRSGVQQHRGMVAVDSRERASEQGPAVLPPVRRELRDGICCLCVRTESPAGYVERAGSPSPGERGVRARRQRRLSAAQRRSELILPGTNENRLASPRACLLLLLV